MAHKYGTLTSARELDKHSFAEFSSVLPKYETITPDTGMIYNLDSLSIVANEQSDSATLESVSSVTVE